MDTQAKAHFCNYLAEGNILCGSKAKTVKEVVTELAEQICHNTGGLNIEEIVHEVMVREKSMPTVIGSGLAVPHARIASVKSLIVAMALSPEGIDFNVPGMPPVHVVILLLTPSDDPGLHLQVLSALSKDFSAPEAVKTICRLKTTSEVMRQLGGSPLAEIPQFLRACDIMNCNPITLKENNTLQEAITLFATRGVDEVPVIDDDNELRGIVSLNDLLKFSLPEHILWLDDLSSVYKFQPFAEMLQTANETKVADFMREEVSPISPDIPAIQIAKLFIMNKLRKLLVVGEDGKLAGEVSDKDFCAELFWK